METTELDFMNKLMTAAAILLLAACAQRAEPQQSSLSQAKEPPSRFQSIGSCEPTAWVWLQNDAERLPPDQRERVKMMLNDAQSYYADDNRGQCILVLQNAERIVRQSKTAS
jgi:type IV pilus biogenesis protein CpaD/CtpE